MFTTELSTRVLLTVLILGPIRGFSHLHEDRDTDNWARTRETKSDELLESRLLSSIEEPGILLPPDDKYNFVGEDDPTTLQSTWRTARGSPFPSTTIVSTNSYSIRPGGGSSSSSGIGSGSSVFINAKPLTIVATGNGYKGQPQTPYSNPKGYQDSLNSKNDKSTVYVKNNCYGPRCPMSSNRQGYDDVNKSYHYIMNKDVNKQKLRRDNDDPVRRNGEDGDFPLEHQMTLSLPFRVEPAVSQSDLQYPYRFPNQNRNNRRVSRTTTTTPGWVKLQPIFPEQYDLFSINTTRRHDLEKQAMSQNSQFSNRLGIELNPESFADRWGWGDDSHRHHQDKGSGSRLPSWLQDIQSSLKGGPTRDSDNNNWVKLDPIPVAGVSISKWVPKGTHSSELPSTNWPTRDHIPNGGGFNNNNNNANNYNKNQWYDQINNINKLSRPTYIPVPVQVESHPGWGPNKQSHIQHQQQQQQQQSWDRNPTNQWNDVIYPSGPSSATASWQQDKDLSKYASSFQISTPPSSPSSWSSDTRRPTSVTGSWSADRDRGRPQYENQPFGGGGNRRHGSNSYPDRSNNDDSRWVLVSNSRKVSVSPSESQRHPPSLEYNSGPNYHPEFDKFSDFPFYYENPYSGNRRGKDVKPTLQRAILGSKPGKQKQDDAFNKINATLASLTPVLSVRGGSTRRTPNLTKIRSSTTTTKAPRRKLPAFMKPYAGDARGVGSGGNNNNNNKTYNNDDEYDYNEDDIRSTTPVQKVRKGMSINPVYAAVGAGMIPATMAAVLPMVLGRKRRDVHYSQTDFNDLPKTRMQNTDMQRPLIFLDYDSYARSPLFISKPERVYDSNSKRSREAKYLYQT